MPLRTKRDRGVAALELLVAVIVTGIVLSTVVGVMASLSVATQSSLIVYNAVPMPSVVGSGSVGAETYATSGPYMPQFPGGASGNASSSQNVVSGSLGGYFPPQLNGVYVQPWDAYYKAPSFPAAKMASDVMKAFIDAVAQADTVLVVGGAAEYPVSRGSTYLSNQTPSVTTVSGYFAGMASLSLSSDPRSLASGYDMRLLQSGYQLSQALPAAALAVASDPADFTVVCLQGPNSILSATECRRLVVGANVLYSVTHYGFPNAPGVLYAYYRFYIPLTSDVWNSPGIGAFHTWYRYTTGFSRVEEGPCTVVFPDPYVLSSQNATSFSSFSRFSYSLDPVSQLK